MREDVVRVEVDRSRCPLCGEPNACVLARRERGEAAPDPCWCVERVFPEALTERATGVDGGASCICHRCLERAGSA